MTAYKRLLRGLLDANVSFLVVGGYAAIAHGLTRATDDLDIWIESTLENAGRTLQVLRAMGFPTDEWTAESIADPYLFVRVGEEAGRRVDIMASAGGDLPFFKAWPNRLETDFFGLSVPFLGLQDLIQIKKAIGRHKDLADVESLKHFHKLPYEGEDED
jgi:hypothetical protein